ncbi:ABC bile acid transporter, the ATP-binding cassette [Mucor ambiguus]|uniref:ABC bile acid transporter, the ATP-binding cassette n=1 Tax=Mucor ambiguus TaxID=91626 RepID=A0A0C9LUV4_9FUNG|nr:ABC bile acid transporter, the ATP-binding cassette [Mucor ambiguus]
MGSLNEIPATFWFSICQVVVLTASSLIFSIQRAYSHHQKLNADPAVPIKRDTERDIANVPFANGNRLSRLNFETLVLTIISVYIFYVHTQQQQQHQHDAVYTVIGSAFTFITWIYCLMLSMTAIRYPLPSSVGWTLNVHLFTLYLVLWVSSIGNALVSWYQTSIVSLVLILPVILGLDLVYTTATVKRGSPFLDEHHQPVISSNVESIIGTLYFFWITPIINTVNSKGKDLTDDDLPRLPITHRPFNLFYCFGVSRGKRLLYRIYLANRLSLAVQLSLSVTIALVMYGQPLFLNKLLLLIQDMSTGGADDRSLILGFGYIVGMALFNILSSLVIAQLWFYAQSSVQIRIRSMLNIELYRKTLRRMDTSISSGKKRASAADKKEEGGTAAIDESNVSSATGLIVNLMSTDAARIADFATQWNTLVRAPTELVFGIYFLYRLLGWSSMMGLLVIVATVPLNHFNTKWFIRLQAQLMKTRDKRVSLMNEVLQGIRQIKFFAWESNWSKRILESREAELRCIKKTYLSEVVFLLLWQGTPLMVTTVAFWSFTKLQGEQLTAPIAFTSIAIFNELRAAFSIIPEAAVRLFETLISVKRIEDYLNEDEISTDATIDTDSDAVKIGFSNTTVCWPTSNTLSEESEDSCSDVTAGQDLEEEATFTLKDLSVIFPNDKLSLICGGTGSGKTLLMLSLLGETEIKQGTVYCPRSATPSTLDESTAITSIHLSEQESDHTVPPNWILQDAIAYVAQTAWLQNASIKDNILFGLPFIKKRYHATLAACALVKDLSYLEDGDSTEIGEKGITLSGGQKARVSLARAVYSRAQNVLMDDVLSAVDAHTAKHLYQQCLLGPLMKNRTQILITHHVNLCIQGSAHVVYVKEGRIQLSGSPADLRQEGKLELIFEESTVEQEEEEEEDREDQTANVDGQQEQALERKAPKVLVEKEGRAQGKVKFRLYRLYFKLVGSWFFWLFFFFTVFTARGLDITSTWWLKTWAQSYESNNHNMTSFAIENGHNNNNQAFARLHQSVFMSAFTLKDDNAHDTDYYLNIYVLINLVSILFGLTRYVTTFSGGIRAGRKLYVLLLDRVLKAPLRFFDTTPIGRVVNRFSKDFETIDTSVPFDMVQFCVQWTTVISILLVATSVLPVLIVPMILVALTNIYFGLRFVAASRELKRMDSVSRSPLFTHFSESIVGVATIRAFGMTQHFMLDMLRKIDNNSRPMYYAYSVSRWVSVRIALMGSLITLLTGTFILFNLGNMDAAMAGFCLSYVTVFTDMIYWGVRRYTSLEMNFNSVERVVEFLEMDQEAPTATDVKPPLEWPNQGAIKVDNLHVRYAADLEPVLRGLTFSINPMEKVGIVGRTGSGKSTLALSFFRFIEASEGSILIDDVDISKIGTKDLRSNLTIIPQDPVLFSGTLGSNMDPFDQFTQEEIFTALRRVHLLNDTSDQDVNQNVFKDLTTSVSEGGKNFSQGQRQLLCLARALLKRSKLVLMDEATASVDFETDKAIQKAITTEFRDSTILCIAHRLNTVIEYDRILVLDHGEILEFASPLDLLQDEDSAFYKMCRNSGEFDNLLELAKAKHQLVDIS